MALFIAVVSTLSALATGDDQSGPAATSIRAAIPDFVEVTGGPFVMGADPARDSSAFDNERWSPTGGHGTVDLPTFYISRHEVTVGQFEAFARGATWTVDSRARAGTPSHPVSFVSWPDALAYCRWLEAALKASNEASPVGVIPAIEYEALSDLVRAREDLRGDLMAARHRISKLLLAPRARLRRARRDVEPAASAVAGAGALRRSRSATRSSASTSATTRCCSRAATGSTR